MFANFNFQQMVSAFIVLFAVIDIIGSIQSEREREGRKCYESNRYFVCTDDWLFLCG